MKRKVSQKIRLYSKWIQRGSVKKAEINRIQDYRNRKKFSVHETLNKNLYNEESTKVRERFNGKNTSTSLNAIHLNSFAWRRIQDFSAQQNEIVDDLNSERKNQKNLQDK